MNNRANCCENALEEKKKHTKCSRNDRGHDCLRSLCMLRTLALQVLVIGQPNKGPEYS